MTLAKTIYTEGWELKFCGGSVTFLPPSQTQLFLVFNRDLGQWV